MSFFEDLNSTFDSDEGTNHINSINLETQMQNLVDSIHDLSRRGLGITYEDFVRDQLAGVDIAVSSIECQGPQAFTRLYLKNPIGDLQIDIFGTEMKGFEDKIKDLLFPVLKLNPKSTQKQNANQRSLVLGECVLSADKIVEKFYQLMNHENQIHDFTNSWNCPVIGLIVCDGPYQAFDYAIRRDRQQIEGLYTNSVFDFLYLIHIPYISVSTVKLAAEDFAYEKERFKETTQWNIKKIESLEVQVKALDAQNKSLDSKIQALTNQTAQLIQQNQQLFQENQELNRRLQQNNPTQFNQQIHPSSGFQPYHGSSTVTGLNPPVGGFQPYYGYSTMTGTNPPGGFQQPYKQGGQTGSVSSDLTGQIPFNFSRSQNIDPRRSSINNPFAPK